MQKKNNPKHLIMFTVNHFYEKYSTFRDYSDSERDMFGRRVTEKIIADLKARGASVSVNGIDINEHYLMFGITCSDKNTSVAYVQMCFIKGHHVHTLIYMSPTGSQNVKECVDIISTITIDGMPIMDWIP
ncbi:hypothetical protein [Anaerovibrio lipolyticus]|uniref:hypothetical protein n=1 Tax=Anaerovibrio lipolyticus TaxID=82374 RepID=UPI0012DF2AE7|nr:hypothetical protein [Anaerovibrio lipolyticus]